MHIKVSIVFVYGKVVSDMERHSGAWRGRLLHSEQGEWVGLLHSERGVMSVHSERGVWLVHSERGVWLVHSERGVG